MYDRRHHAAARTEDYVFHQLIPYIGNKRKLLDLIGRASTRTGPAEGRTFLDLFAGSGVVSRFAKRQGYRVLANDWEPYAEVINQAYVACNQVPPYHALGGYEAAIAHLNAVPPRTGWITEHLCPDDDEHYDDKRDRLFYMRKNGRRIDAIRKQIDAWAAASLIDQAEAACLLAPLLYQACYTSNTSGVFKGFHRGWGGQTQTALYRIASDLTLAPACFFDNGQPNEVHRMDAQRLAEALAPTPVDVAYLDPPYNQHPYASNYHVLNTITLWDAPTLTKKIEGRNKAAIRTDWRTERRSAYNYRRKATRAYQKLVRTLNARFILTSYSTDGMIPLERLLEANAERGAVQVLTKTYKRYRVSTQRFSDKPLNVEFVVVTDTAQQGQASVEALVEEVYAEEAAALAQHLETLS